MAFSPGVPPQAYTREILSTAFNWLQSQPEAVKRQATTPDVLVGLYKRAQRMTPSSSSLETEAPISSQAFMSDLKNLAEGLKQFEEPKQAHSHQPHPDFFHEASLSAPLPPSSSPLSPSLPTGINERSLAMIREVKNQFNLNSDSEAINMMVALAYKSLKNLLV